MQHMPTDIYTSQEYERAQVTKSVDLLTCLLSTDNMGRKH